MNKYNRLGIDYSDMAILYRTNLLSNSIKSALTKKNIRYKIKGEDRNIYDNFAVRDIISYLKIAISDYDMEDLVNIANKPLRYISRDSIKNKNTTIDNLIKYYRNKDYMQKYLARFKFDLKNISNNITALAIRYIRTKVGYDKYLNEFCRNNDIDYEEIVEVLDAFEDESILHKDIKEFLKYIESEETKKNDNVEKEVEKDIDAINLMTFHLSKGLEFKVVFIIDSNDGLIPHKKSIRENDLETERRLFYVAMTRAKDNLHIFFTVRRFGKNFKPSRFIIDAIGG